MYARSHIYLTEKITGSTNPLLLFGSLLPDFHQTSALPKRFDNRVVEFFNFLNKEYSALVPLAVGMTLHEFPIGVDRFTHQSYKKGNGYGFQFDGQLSEETKKVFDCDDQMAKLMNHFLVENAIEYKLVTEHPEINERLKQCFDGIDREKIVEALSKFYGSSISALNEEFDLYFHTTFDYDYGNYESMGKSWADTMKRVLGKTADPKEIARLIKLTSEIIEPSVDEFIQTCVEECKKDFGSEIKELGEEV
ncbi:hypothetical protein GOV03_02025 [Candidatus Woesearchaeota archaeon]|nr:hypothetical protein [Candidatus Woesearchaeota archaeon]